MRRWGLIAGTLAVTLSVLAFPRTATAQFKCGECECPTPACKTTNGDKCCAIGRVVQGEYQTNVPRKNMTIIFENITPATEERIKEILSKD